MASEPELPSMVVVDSDSESTDDGFDDCLEIPSAALQEACLPADDLPVDTLLECKIPSVFEPRELSEEAQFPYTEPSALVEVSSQELQDPGIPSFEKVASLLRAGKAQRKQGTKSVTFRGKSFPFWILALWDRAHEALNSQLAWNREPSETFDAVGDHEGELNLEAVALSDILVEEVADRMATAEPTVEAEVPDQEIQSFIVDDWA